MTRVRIVMLAATLTLLASGCLWPQAGFGPDRRSFNAGETSLTTANVASLFESWTVELPQGSSEPVVSDGRLFVTSGFNVYALTASGGESIWTRSIDTTWPEGFRLLGAPMVRADTGEVAVPANRYEGGGRQTNRFLRYDVATGAARPDVGASGTDSTQRGARLVSTGTLVVPLGGQYSSVSVTDRDANSSWGGLTPATGAPTLGESALYLAGSGAVAAYDPSTPCPPYPPSPSILFCLPTWSTPVDGSARAAVISEDATTLYVGTSAGRVYALDAVTGVVRWSTAVGSAITQAPALAYGTLYVPTDGGTLVTLPVGSCSSTTTCPIGWTANGGGSLTAQPAVAGGVVYIGAADGTVTALAANGCGQGTCPALWTSPALSWLGTQGGAVKGLAVAAGSLYVGRAQGVTHYIP